MRWNTQRSEEEWEMPTLGVRGQKALKVVHFCCIGLWVGGVASWVPLAVGLDVVDSTRSLESYLAMRAIAWNVIGWGGIGTVVSGIALAGLSRWGLLRHRWVMAKLVLAPALVLFGMFFLERRMIQNLTLLQAGAPDPATLAALSDRHASIQLGLGVQLFFFLAVIVISVTKPRFQRTRGPRTSGEMLATEASP